MSQRDQLAQWLNSYVTVRGHEPFAHEIEAFLERQNRLNSPAGFSCRAATGAADSRRAWPLQSFHLPES